MKVSVEFGAQWSEINKVSYLREARFRVYWGRGRAKSPQSRPVVLEHGGATGITPWRWKGWQDQGLYLPLNYKSPTMWRAPMGAVKQEFEYLRERGSFFLNRTWKRFYTSFFSFLILAIHLLPGETK
jgi:hypothetical protein